jgi:multiple sugar transport system permease protein
MSPRRQGYLFTLPAVVAILLLIGFPVLYVFWLSFSRWYGSQEVPPQFVALRNYTHILLRDDYFHRAFTVTTTFTALTVTASIVLGLGLALLLQREFRGHSLVRTLLMIPVVSTPVAVSLTWRYILVYEGWLNWITSSLGLGVHAWLGAKLVLPVLAVVDVTRWTSLVMLIIMAGLSTLPTEPVEAAIVDGASGLQVLRYITLPLLRPYVGVAALIRAIDAIKTFDIVMVITGGGPAGASEMLYLYGYKVSFHFLTFGYASAVLVLLFLTVLVVSLVIIKLRRASW